MRVAVLGLGSAGRRHAAHVAAAGHDVVGWDPGPGATADVAQAPSLEDAIASADAAIVASPSALHAEQARAALAADCHVLVEKPLATSATEAEALAAAAAETSLVCGVAMNLRFHPGVLRLRELVSGGALGTPLVAAAQMGYALPLWRPGTDYTASYSARAELGGGILWDAIHELDYLLWVLGPVASVSAELATVSDLDIDVEDTAMAILRFASGVMCTVSLDFVQPAYRRGCLVAGSEATAVWDWRDGTVTVRAEGSPDRIEDVAFDVAESYGAEVEDFLAAAQAGGTPRTTFAEGAGAVRLAEALRVASAEGRRVVLGGVVA